MSDGDFLSVVIPTYNEVENIAGVIKRTIVALDASDSEYEILIIDDASQDNTVSLAEKILGNKGKVIRRSPEERSLSLSVLEGIKQAKGNIIVAMDGDGSHPPELIADFIRNLHLGYDLVIASRYVEGGSTQGFSLKRRVISRFACLAGRILTSIKDNTSGFFCIKKEALNGVKFTPYGFKIGLEIFVKANFKAFKEIPYTFVDRKGGRSKFNLKVGIQYLLHLLKLLNYKSLK